MRPDELVVLVSLCEDTQKKTWLAIEHASDICVGDAGVPPGCVYGYTHLIFVEVSCSAVELHNACCGATRDLMQACALGG